MMKTDNGIINPDKNFLIAILVVVLLVFQPVTFSQDLRHYIASSFKADTKDSITTYLPA
jgi:hypothetical protein